MSSEHPIEHSSRPRYPVTAWLLIFLLLAGCSGPSQPVAPVAKVTPQSAAETHLQEVCTLIARRLELMPGVAQAKWNRKLPITDEKREQSLLAKLAADGEALQLPAEFVTEFFRAQMTAAKHVQEQTFQEWTAQQHPPFENPPDLEQVVRPQIDQINRQLLEALAKCWAARNSADWDGAVNRAVRAAFQRTTWDEAIISTATKPLRGIAATK